MSRKYIEILPDGSTKEITPEKYEESTKPIKSEWLKQQPSPEEISDSPEGGKHIPIELVKKKLDYLTDSIWQTVNFKQDRFYDHDGDLWYDGSVQLIVTYDNGISRLLVGAATFNTKTYTLTPNPNYHFSATLLSNCIKNAAMNLGPQFGSELNTTSIQVIQRKEPVKTKPDKEQRTIYAHAVANGHTELIDLYESLYDFQE